MGVYRIEKDEMMFDRQHNDDRSALWRALGVSGANSVSLRLAERQDISIMSAIRGIALFGEEVVA